MKQWILWVGTVGLSVAVAAWPALAQETGSVVPSAVFDWKVRPEVGSRYVRRTFNRTQMQMSGLPSVPVRSRGSAAGKGSKTPTSVSMNTIVSSVADYDVLSRDAQGATTVKLTYRTYRTFSSNTSTFMPGVSMAAVRTAQDRQSKMMQDIFAGLILTMKIAPDGRIWSVLGLDKLRSRMTRVFASMPGGGAAVQMLGKDFLSEDSYKKALAQNMGALPPHPIVPGDSWPYQISLPLPMGISSGIQGTRTLVSRRDGVATIKDSSTFNLTQDASKPGTSASAPPSAQFPIPGFAMRLQGNQDGSTTVDEASGLPREASTSMVMSGHMTFPDPRASSASAAKPKPGASPSFSPIRITITGRSTTRTVLEPVAKPA